MEPSRTPGRRHALTVPVRVHRDGVGGPTKSQAAGPHWRRSSHGLYVPSSVEPTGLQRVLEAGVLMPRFGAVTGWAALAWLGGRWFTGVETDGTTPRPIPVAVSRHQIRPQPGLALCEERLDPRELEVVDGIAVTNAVRSVCFEIRRARDLTAAVVALDMAAYDDLVSVDEVAHWIFGHPSYVGIEQGRDAVPLGQENSWSPMEVRVRMVWPAGLGEPLANRPIFDRAGRHVRTPDLVDPLTGVVAEYDGGDHATALRRRSDRDRDEIYRHHRLECVVVMAGDLREPEAVIQRLRAAYARAAGHPTERSWTLQLPHWWVDTSTVAKRRSLDELDRRHWLGYRSAA